MDAQMKEYLLDKLQLDYSMTLEKVKLYKQGSDGETDVFSLATRYRGNGGNKLAILDEANRLIEAEKNHSAELALEALIALPKEIMDVCDWILEIDPDDEDVSGIKSFYKTQYEENKIAVTKSLDKIDMNIS